MHEHSITNTKKNLNICLDEALKGGDDDGNCGGEKRDDEFHRFRGERENRKKTIYIYIYMRNDISTTFS